MENMRKVRKTMMKVLGYLIIFLFMMMTAVGSYQIITRYFFNRPSTVSEELLTYSFTWMALLISAYVFGKRDHMRMEFFAQRFTGKAKLALEVTTEALVLAFAAIVMVYGGVEITRLTMTQVTASLQIPMGYVYFVLPLSGLMIVFFSFVNILDLIQGQKNGQEEK